MACLTGWAEGIGGNFAVHKAVSEILPKETKIVSAESCGTSSWTRTAKLSVILPGGSPKRYFLKCIRGQGARALVEGEYRSASAIEAVVPGFVPEPVGWGQYSNDQSQEHFYVGAFHDMDLAVAPEPEYLMSQLAELHQRGTSPNGMFGFPVATVLGKFERTVTWEKSWAKAFARQLEDVINFDNETNGPWPEYDSACKQLIDVVIPRLLGALQSEGREIKPALIHGDFWENNVGVDMETGKMVVFDPGSTYAHNEMVFGTWRCSWAFHFNSPIYMRLYQRHVEPSEPVEEWDDRNRLYSIHPYLNDSAGHPGSVSRQLAYNDMLYLYLQYLLKDTPEKVEDVQLSAWDSALFNQELVHLKIAPVITNLAKSDVQTQSEENVGDIEEGTWAGSQLALTDLYRRIEHGAHLFHWSDGTDNYPPHLEVPRHGGIPKPYNAPQYEIFNACGLLNAAGMLVKITPKTFLGTFAQKIWSAAENLINGRGYQGISFAELEMHNREWRKTAVDVMKGKNLGDLPDWFSDAKFAQQSFTGANPNTIRLASDTWISSFKQAAEMQKLSAVLDFIQKAETRSLYVQDCSYFREAVKAQPKAELKAEDRYGTAAVALYHLSQSGRLHPIAIIIDWRGSVQDSVTIFNKQLIPLDPQSSDYESQLKKQKSDWPWRYAKTCAQLLEPHWYKTLPPNAAARETLVPKIILELVGFSGSQPYDFIKYAFAGFDFTANYVPQDLASRGFPESELRSPRLRNYPYAQNILSIWNTIRKFVHSMVGVTKYSSDNEVANDAPIRSWYKQIRNEGQIPSFPEIKTSDQLIDAITMCIHVASPQHTAINYLQNFYMGFVPAKPPCLYTPLPKTREELGRKREEDLLHALPVGHQREWLLATQIPWLLSYKPAEEANLFTYSDSLYNLLRKKSGLRDKKVTEIAKVFHEDLRALIEQFKASSDNMTTDTVPYIVMNPGTTAVSILL
ncbi:uncharacterized protein KY384_004397 [Bacidia gigantensis]|uniref:uncharacterized protein n=1 Tax=Bacidia gigantensis TaxID=2732470 RepID=UPI001D04C3CA|nr:uncharacterized protein KY384_004397 [Bacidia gigantensis]KAG8531040.1 hypothetical protein KY384_004397 [Bacidia gigantensis]